MQPTRRQAGGPFLSFVKPAYRKGYEVPGLAYQTGGIKSISLWNTRESVLRIVPGYDKATGQVFPQNINVNEFSIDAGYDDYLSDTFLTASIVSNFGARGQTFITSYAPGSEDAQRYGGDTVINQFVKNVTNSVLNAEKGKRTKFQVTDDMKQWCSKDGPIKYPRQALLFQALIFKRNGIENKDENGNLLLDEEGNSLPVFGVVSVDGKQTLLEVMKALVDPMDPGKPLNASTNNRYGAFAGLEDGVVMFLNPVQDNTTGARMLRPSVQEPTSSGWNKTPFPLDEETVKSLWVPWEDLLQYMTAEEQCKLLAQEFGSDSVNYFIGTDPMFNGMHMPDEIANAGLGRYARFVSGAAATGFAAPRPAPSAARTGFGLGKAAAQPAQTPVDAALSASFVKAPVPKSPGLAGLKAAPAQAKPGLAGLRANAAIDQEKLKAALSGIRSAQKPQQPTQTTMAQQLMNDQDLEGYIDDNLGDQEN